MNKLFKKICKFRHRNNKAFSLLEVMLAVVLLAIIATPIIQTVYTSMSLNVKSRAMMGAMDVGQSLMEYFENSTSEEIKNELGTNNASVALTCIGYTGVASVSSSGSYGATLDDFEDFCRANLLNLSSYGALMTGGSMDYNFKKVLSYSGDDRYLITNVDYNGFSYSVVVILTSTTASGSYSVNEVEVVVYYNDPHRDGDGSWGRYGMNDLMVDLHGSVFNKVN